MEKGNFFINELLLIFQCNPEHSEFFFNDMLYAHSFMYGIKVKFRFLN